MCSKSLQEEISSGKQSHCRKQHHGWLENKWVERERKNWTESCLLSPTLLLAPAKSRKPMSTWSVMEESLIPVVWLCSSLWCTCGCVEHFRRLLAQKSFFVVHVLCTCLLAFSLSLSAFCYRICFATEYVLMEIVSPVMYNPPNIHIIIWILDYKTSQQIFVKMDLLKLKDQGERYPDWGVNSCFVFHPWFSFFAWKSPYNLRWIRVIFSLCFSWLLVVGLMGVVFDLF